MRSGMQYLKDAVVEQLLTANRGIGSIVVMFSIILQIVTRSRLLCTWRSVENKLLKSRSHVVCATAVKLNAGWQLPLRAPCMKLGGSIAVALLSLEIHDSTRPPVFQSKQLQSKKIKRRTVVLALTNFPPPFSSCSKTLGASASFLPSPSSPSYDQHTFN